MSSPAPHTAIFRVLVMPGASAQPGGSTFGSWGLGTQPWEALPVPLLIDPRTLKAMSGTDPVGGYQIESIKRTVFPDEDSAQFYVDFGDINNQEVIPRDLSNYDVQIQVYDDEDGPGTALVANKWKPVFVGTVIYMRNALEPESGADNSGDAVTRKYGRRTYYCAGIAWRMKNWPLDWHRVASATYMSHGHPGYNAPMNGYFRQVIGNKSTVTGGLNPTGDTTASGMAPWFLAHALPYGPGDSRATAWTDEEAIKHALASSRTKGDPWFNVDINSSGLFSGIFPWSIAPGESCFDFLRRICNRNRGRGGVFVDYGYTAGSNAITLTLKARSTIPAPLVADGSGGYYRGLLWYDKTSSQSQELLVKKSIGYAESDGLTYLDLRDQYRLVDGSVTYDSRATSVMDYVEIRGEKIQICTNLNTFSGSLAKGWTDADAVALNAITSVDLRVEHRWRNVYRRFRIPGPDDASPWDYTTKSEPSGDAHPVDYYVQAGPSAAIVTENSSGTHRTSYVSTRFLPDLPIYEGWDYSQANPVRFDGAATYLPDPRQPPIILYRTDTALSSPAEDCWADLGRGGFNYQVDDYGFYILHSSEEQAGARLLAPSTTTLWQSGVLTIPDCAFTTGFDLNRFSIVCGLELSSHCRVARYRDDDKVTLASDATYNFSRRMTINVDGAHLWLGSPDAAFDWDPRRDNGKAKVLRKFYANSGGGSGETLPYIIRDDRPALSQIAALAWYYYGTQHNPASWALKCCGFQTAYSKIFRSGAKDRRYWMLGDLIGEMTWGNDDNGTVSLNTPVTSIEYDHDRGVTTWRTDAIQYDGSQP